MMSGSPGLAWCGANRQRGDGGDMDAAANIQAEMIAVHSYLGPKDGETLTLRRIGSSATSIYTLRAPSNLQSWTPTA